MSVTVNSPAPGAIRAPALRVLRILLAGATVALAGCSDLNAPAGMTPVRRGPAQAVTTVNLETEIQKLLGQFPAGLGTAARARWENVKRQWIQDNRSGRAQHVALADWIQKRTSQLTPVSGETREQTAGRLVLYMSLYLYNGPTYSPPEIPAGSDIGFGIVEPADVDTVRTQAQWAAAVFPENSVSEPTVIVINQNPLFYPEKCSGPLATTLCQYPLFYHFNAFPDQRFNVSVTAAVCHVRDGDRGPLADHDRFRLAHDKPSDPSRYHPEGTIHEGIEILKYVEVGQLVDCEGDVEYEPVHTHAASGPMGRAWQLAGALASKVYGVFAPRTLYAIDRGGGGETDAFSNFGTVDPDSRPDLVASGLTVSSTTVAAGEEVTITGFTMSNAGTATAFSAQPTVVVASDSMLAQGVQAQIPLATVSSLAPGASSTAQGISVTMPAQPGVYYLGVVTDRANAIAEENESNNAARVAITVRGDLPDPVLVLEGTERYTTGNDQWYIRYNLDVTNHAAYPDEMFAAAPHLPPCGQNTSSSRTWVHIHDGTGQRIYGFCALGQASDLNLIWFAIEEGSTPPAEVYITMVDRETNTTYTSNRVVISPPPVLR